MCYHGNHVRVEAGHNYVSLEGSRLPKAEGLTLRVRFRQAAPQAAAWVGGRPVRFTREADGGMVVETPLAAVRVEVR